MAKFLDLKLYDTIFSEFFYYISKWSIPMILKFVLYIYVLGKFDNMNAKLSTVIHVNLALIYILPRKKVQRVSGVRTI
jgi:hypothetical protein